MIKCWVFFVFFLNAVTSARVVAYLTTARLISPQGAPVSGEELCDANAVPRSPSPAGSRGIVG